VGSAVTRWPSTIAESRSTVQRWTAGYLTDPLAGLADRSHRLASCPHQAPTRWRRGWRRGADSIRGRVTASGWRCCASRCRAGGDGGADHRPDPAPFASVEPVRGRGGSRSSGSSPGPMRLRRHRHRRLRPAGRHPDRRGYDVNLVTAPIHSRFCVSAAAVERATSRAVCLALRPRWP
jgi:hypothetical protein